MDSKPGKAVRWLPIGLAQQEQSVATWLPCPVTDLIRLVNCAHDPRAIRSLLRRNPALMLFALHIFQRRHGQAAESAKQLLTWCQPNLVHAIGQSDLDSIAPADAFALSRKKQTAFFETFLRARSNRKLRRALRQFLVLYCGESKSSSKQLVSRLVGNTIRANDFKCKQIRRQSTCDSIVSDWRTNVGANIDVGGLFQLAVTSLESRTRFDERLHEEKLASMKQLAYGASHEINNPLANIATRAQTMLAIESDPEKRYKLAVIYEQAMRAHEMISDMMLFAHPPGLNQKRVSVRVFMAKIFHELQPALSAAPDVEFRVSVAAGVDQANVDETQLAVAIKHLVQNSLESLRGFNELAPRIEVRISEHQDCGLQFSIWDNGSRISDEVARHMFDPFYSGREAGRGLGFGLSKVWTIARIHGGTLKHDRKSKNGTLFVLRIPRESTDLEVGPQSILSICKNRSSVDEEAA